MVKESSISRIEYLCIFFEFTAPALVTEKLDKILVIAFNRYLFDLKQGFEVLLRIVLVDVEGAPQLRQDVRQQPVVSGLQALQGGHLNST